MDLITLIYCATGVAVAALLLILLVSSIRERQTRAALISAGTLLGFAIIWYLGYILTTSASWPLLIPSCALIVFFLLFFLPVGSTSMLRMRDSDEQFDERDVIFAREEYEAGSEKHASYYQMRPELRDIDNKIRNLPEMFKPGGRYYDPLESVEIDSLFAELEKLTTSVDGHVANKREEITSSDATAEIRDILRRAGARSVGIAQLKKSHVYSHVGRGPEPWGSPILNRHPYVVVFSVEMEYESVESAPRLPISRETVRRYLQAARISIDLASALRRRGYSARAHIAGSNYQIVFPAVAYEAGLGELSRMGYLITPDLGPRVRLGAVTTDMPLETDRPISFGVDDFCRRCRKCASNCPSAAIPARDKTWVRGVEKWQLNAERCLQYWRAIGTDCGLCMRVCPFSHPPTLIHTLVRAGIRRSAFARAVSVIGDDLLYGSKREL